MSELVVVNRAGWGSLPTSPAPAPARMSELYVHHVAGRVPTSLADERLHMRELQAYALGGKGGKYPPGYYSDMDYNAVLGPSGTLYEGRGFFARSAATLDRNDVSRALVMMGNLDVREPTAAQLEMLPHAIAYLVAIGSLVPNPAMLGHFQNPEHPGATICPGRFMIPHLPSVFAGARALMAAPVPQPPSIVTPWEDDMAKLITPSDANGADGKPLRTDAAVFVTDGLFAKSAVSAEVLDDLVNAGLVPPKVNGQYAITITPRRMLKSLTLIGPPPDYSTPPPANLYGRSYRSDFAPES